MNKNFYILIANAILLASGIMLVLVSAVQYTNFWPFIIIFVNMFAIMWPTLCGGCSLQEEFSYQGNEGSITPGSVSWVLLGFFVTVGYAIPIELFRANKLTETATYLTLAGGTTMLAAILVFIRVLYFEKDSYSAYMF